MEKDSGHKLTELAVDGGMCNSDLAMQVSRDQGSSKARH
jgi:glycerol kinase